MWPAVGNETMYTAQMTAFEAVNTKIRHDFQKTAVETQPAQLAGPLILNTGTQNSVRLQPK